MDSEAAIIADLPPGLYTTIVVSKASSGVGLIERSTICGNTPGRPQWPLFAFDIDSLNKKS
jgi:hypothetical protein